MLMVSDKKMLMLGHPTGANQGGCGLLCQGHHRRLREFNAGPVRNRVPKEAESSQKTEEEEKRTQT